MIDTKIQDTPSVLPETLRRCGYKLQQVHRSQYVAVYSVTDIETQQAHGFEIFAQLEIKGLRKKPVESLELTF